MLGLAWKTIKGRRGGFVAAFIAVFCGSAAVTASGILLESGFGGGVATERYAAAAVVVGADQSLPLPEDIDPAFGERVTLPASRVADVAKVPGVASAVGDIGFAANLVGPDRTVVAGPDGGAVLGHGWASAALGSFTLTPGGAPPRRGEIVLDADLAKRAGVAAGQTVELAVRSKPVRYRVSGTVSSSELRRQSAVFFDDDQARELAGRPDRVDAIGVLAQPGVDATVLAERISAAVPDVVAHTGRDRGDAEFLDVGQTRSFLAVVAGSFGGGMVMVVVFVVASTLGLSVQQRRRELALLRAIGATPRQIHRMIGAESLLVSCVAAVLGVLPGVLVAWVLRDAFAAAGTIPPDFELAIGPVPGLIGVVLCVAGARAAGYVAARRGATISPIDALGEAAVEPPGLSRGRLRTGWLLALGAVALATTLPLTIPGQAAVAGAASAALLLVIAVGLLGPRLLGGAIRTFAPLVSISSRASGFLAAANARANVRKLSTATTPLIMGVTMAAVQIFTVTTSSATALEQTEKGITADYVVTSSASGVSPEVADAVRDVPGVTAVTPVARTQVLVRYTEAGDAAAEPFTTQGIAADGLKGTLDLDVREGGLQDLKGDTVALSVSAAATIGVEIGETVDMHLGDGTAIKPRVIAVYGNGLGFGDITLPHNVVVDHTTHRLDAAVLVKAQPGADTALAGVIGQYPGAALADRAAFSAAQQRQIAGESTVNLIVNAVLLGYIAIAVVNTLVMATAARVREFALLRLIGANRGQVIRMMRAETGLVIVTSLVLGSLAAAPPLIGISLGLAESPLPAIPPLAVLGILAVAALLGWFSIMLPARLAMRPKPIDAIGIRE
ncbi:ABC transporter permease [Actinosynnema sp. ALI-1.44]|uniref:ABC transporter permease n=1 Tax=Actinosynnema sp. ALI-1.44 TaxID=1933779 RepID=UPI00097C9ECD|nr:FtsX-like permease family protein [Actinosynnema sp. ALI-1.44]ONI76013.1 ABC transporter permease [Actinosynnema sp. ALI-1.44]